MLKEYLLSASGADLEWALFWAAFFPWILVIPFQTKVMFWWSVVDLIGLA